MHAKMTSELDKLVFSEGIPGYLRMKMTSYEFHLTQKGMLTRQPIFSTDMHAVPKAWEIAG